MARRNKKDIINQQIPSDMEGFRHSPSSLRRKVVKANAWVANVWEATSTEVIWTDGYRPASSHLVPSHARAPGLVQRVKEQ